jgi:Zn finger protein HypA/HybF involved in hydrogenase expression
MKVNKSNDTKHFYCAICEARLDRVARWNKVEKYELILKLNLIKEVGDHICNKCNSRVRILDKMMIYLKRLKIKIISFKMM